jgi:hypothetical protein
MAGLCALTIGLVALLPRPAAAQEQERWGVQVYGTPSWEIAGQLKKIMFEDDETGTLKGSEVGIGLVHGRTRGGDWGISFVRKPFDDASGVRSEDAQCTFNNKQCWTEVEDTRFRGVYLNAFELHWAPAFVTIKNRVQIGINVGGGLGAMKGNVVKTKDGFNVGAFNNQTQLNVLTPFHTVETTPASEELMKYFPLIKIEAVGSFILTHSLKVKVAGGVNFPAYSTRVMAVYFFGK